MILGSELVFQFAILFLHNSLPELSVSVAKLQHLCSGVQEIRCL